MVTLRDLKGSFEIAVAPTAAVKEVLRRSVGNESQEEGMCSSCASVRVTNSGISMPGGKVYTKFCSRLSKSVLMAGENKGSRNSPFHFFNWGGIKAKASREEMMNLGVVSSVREGGSAGRTLSSCSKKFLSSQV